MLKVTAGVASMLASVDSAPAAPLSRCSSGVGDADPHVPHQGILPRPGSLQREDSLRRQGSLQPQGSLPTTARLPGETSLQWHQVSPQRGLSESLHQLCTGLEDLLLDLAGQHSCKGGSSSGTDSSTSSSSNVAGRWPLLLQLPRTWAPKEFVASKLRRLLVISLAWQACLLSEPLQLASTGSLFSILLGSLLLVLATAAELAAEELLQVVSISRVPTQLLLWLQQLPGRLGAVGSWSTGQQHDTEAVACLCAGQAGA